MSVSGGDLIGLDRIVEQNQRHISRFRSENGAFSAAKSVKLSDWV